MGETLTYGRSGFRGEQAMLTVPPVPVLIDSIIIESSAHAESTLPKSRALRQDVGAVPNTRRRTAMQMRIVGIARVSQESAHEHGLVYPRCTRAGLAPARYITSVADAQ